MRVPGATYRLQINDDFTLDDARSITPYLARLGITDLYLSPVFEARRGSMHGYDVTDPTRIRESVGGMAALLALSDTARQHGLGILFDIVPNHMAASIENPWWRDVLMHGPASNAARFFDIDWGTSGSPRRLRLPVLDGTIERAVDRREIRIVDARELDYRGIRLPLAPGTVSRTAADATTVGAARENAARENAARENAAPDDAAPEAVHAVLARQHYELVPWRDAAREMSYRRFFDIADLVAVRVEDDDVFRVTHALVRDLARDGVITGLRVDHVDGLRDPFDYLQRLRDYVRDPDGGPVFTLVEKILGRDETLPADWDCEGTTGYEFMKLATGLLIQPEGLGRIDNEYQRITGDTRAFGELVREKKLLVIERLFGGELDALAQGLAGLTSLAHDDARRAIADVTASMRVYRTCIRDGLVSEQDRCRINEAVDDALRRARDERSRSAIDVMRRVALPGVDANPAQIAWVMDWQQLTGPVMAKGFEDTALYCHNALLAANDVGSDPASPCLSSAEMHAALQQRLAASPCSLNATATHDTKRGEDTRARIAVLSEVSEEWRACLDRWLPAAVAAAEDAPSADVECMLYQTLLGAWPLGGVDDVFRERIKAYMTKAVREAKERTSWGRPDDDYETALDNYIERLMAEFGAEGRADEVHDFAQRIAPHGALNAIAQVLLKVTAPGIPDFYQGTELWSHTLVDPDNRARVDFDHRASLFCDVAEPVDSPDGPRARCLLEMWRDGRLKLFATAIALRFRAAHRDVVQHGAVIPLAAVGGRADHVFAFARCLDDRACITVLPRWTAALAEGAAAWDDTIIPLPRSLRRPWREALTGTVHSTCDATVHSTCDATGNVTGAARGDTPDDAAAGALRVSDLFRWLPFALLGEDRT